MTTELVERFEVQSVTEESVTVAVTLRRAAEVMLSASGPEGGRTEFCIGCDGIARGTLTGLHAGTRYTIEMFVEGAPVHGIVVRTLPVPQGAVLASFAILADTHLSARPAVWHGRLFPEATVILRDVLREMAGLGLDFILVAGDVTDQGLPEEYAMARRALAEASCPVLAVPGDHDVKHGLGRFEASFGPGRWVREIAGMTVVGCNTSSRSLHREGAGHLSAALRSASGKPVLIVSHTQLVPDGYIVDADKVAQDHADYAEQVVPLIPAGSLAYIGHKNVPAHHRAGGLLQLNVPQTVQYPCGWLLVRRYANGFYHTFRPIFSEALNDLSRRASNARGAHKWTEAYRRGGGPELWNFVAGKEGVVG